MIKKSSVVSNLANTIAKNISNYNEKATTVKSKSLDRTYTGRITNVEMIDGKPTGKCQIAFDNKSMLIQMADNNTHYVSEAVRVFVPNGVYENAYAESVVSASCSNVIISKNQMVFCTKVTDEDSQEVVENKGILEDAVTTYQYSFSEDEDGNAKAEKSALNIKTVIKLDRLANGKPQVLTYPDGKVVVVKYETGNTNY